MPSRTRLVLALTILLGPTAVFGQGDTAVAASGSARCGRVEHRQFDFWLGTWEVRGADGILMGHNEVTLTAGGCGLLESWRGVEGSRGVSVNAYDETRRRWTQVGWVTVPPCGSRDR